MWAAALGALGSLAGSSGGGAAASPDNLTTTIGDTKASSAFVNNASIVMGGSKQTNDASPSATTAGADTPMEKITGSKYLVPALIVVGALGAVFIVYKVSKK